MQKIIIQLLSCILISYALFGQESIDTISHKYHFVLAENDTIQIDSIIISGNSETKDFIIRQELTIAAGSKINNEIINYNVNRIYSLGLFTKVEYFLYSVINKIHLEIKVYERWFVFPYPIIGLKDRDWGKFYYGLGLAHQNFLGRNQKVFIQFALGYDPWVNLHYYNPHLDKSSSVFLDGNINYSKVKNKSKSFGENNGDFHEIWSGGNISLGKRIGLYYYLWTAFNYNILSVSNATVKKTISPDGVDHIFSVQLNGQYNTRDIGEYPMKGSYIVGSISKIGFGMSEINYTNIFLDLRKYFPTILSSSICFRTFSSLNFGPVLPYYSHQYYGYGERIRGYFNEIQEAENIFGFSCELRIPLIEPQYLVLKDFPVPEFSILRYALSMSIFYDFGEVWNRYDFKFNKLKSGFGVGLNFLLPYSVVLRTEYAINKDLRGEFIFDAGVSF